eukprot:5851458-Alexandrium_andersonii.AAC.1
MPRAAAGGKGEPWQAMGGEGRGTAANAGWQRALMAGQDKADGGQPTRSCERGGVLKALS